MIRAMVALALALAAQTFTAAVLAQPASQPTSELVPPRVIDQADIPYPDGAIGSAEVFLFLVIDAAGRVISA